VARSAGTGAVFVRRGQDFLKLAELIGGALLRGLGAKGKDSQGGKNDAAHNP
jgi:hypothetical protein